MSLETSLESLKKLFSSGKLTQEQYSFKVEQVRAKHQQVSTPSTPEKKNELITQPKDLCSKHGPFIGSTCLECTFSTLLSSSAAQVDAFGFPLKKLIEMCTITSSQVIASLFDKNQKSGLDMKKCMETLRLEKFDIMDETLSSLSSESPHVAVYLVLVQLQQGEDLEDIKDEITNYLKKCESFDTLLLICLAKYFRKIESYKTSKFLYQLVLTAPRFSTLVPWMTKEEINFVSSEDLVVSTHNKPSDPLRDEWNVLKKSVVASCKALDDLMELTGMTIPKQIAFDLYRVSMVNSNITQNKNKVETRNNFIFYGNPGTGKTSIARLYGNMLFEIGVRRKNVFLQVTAQEALRLGAKKFEQDYIEKAVDGVLFIDEAYQLDPFSNAEGKAIVETLMSSMDKYEKNLTIILAGYKEDITKKILEFNDGLKRRFPYIVEFEDFTYEQLVDIWQGLLTKNKSDWKAESKLVGEVACRRLEKSRGRKGFGNAGDVVNLFEACQKKALSRQVGKNPPELFILMQDLIGSKPDRSTNTPLEKILNKFEKQIGWTKVKESVSILVNVASNNWNLEMQGKSPQSLYLNALFLGNPGTGKTTCAEMYGELLKALNFLSDGKLVKKTGSDFIGSTVGSTPEIVRKIFAEAQGKVLLIDEAYNIWNESHSGVSYGVEALGTICEQVWGSPGQDLCVIMCGYEEPLVKMLNKGNEGLPRRFEQRFQFLDYSDKELYEICTKMIANMNLSISWEFKKRLVKYVSSKRNMVGFGNAGAIQTALEKVSLHSQKRPYTNPIKILEEDVAILDTKKQDPFDMLDSLFSVDHIKKDLKRISNQINVAIRENRRKDIEDIKSSLYFLFTGPPGTGKTTVANSLASILFNMGLIPTEKVIMTSPTKIEGKFVGESGERINKLLDDALGGVLFIDEAYGLQDNPFGKKVIEALVAAMTSQKHGNGNVVIVLAGYTHKIQELMNVNSGLAGRFHRTIEFKPLNSEDSWKFLKSLIEKDKFELKDENQVQDWFMYHVGRACVTEAWGNYRDVVTIFKKAREARSDRVLNAPENIPSLTMIDFKQEIEKLCTSRVQQHVGQLVSNFSNFQPLPLPIQENVSIPSVEKQGEKQLEVKKVIEEKQENLKINHKDVVLRSLDNAFKELKYTEESVLDALNAPNLPQDIIDYVCNGTTLDESVVDTLLQEEKMEMKIRFQEIVRVKKEEEATRRRIKEEEERLKLLKEEEQKIKMEMLRREREEMEKREKVQERLRQLGPCPAGFRWFKVGYGWRCGGGSHFVSDSEIERYMM